MNPCSRCGLLTNLDPCVVCRAELKGIRIHVAPNMRQASSTGSTDVGLGRSIPDPYAPRYASPGFIAPNKIFRERP